MLVLTVHVNFVSHRAVSTNHHFCFKSSFAQKKWLVPIDCKSVMKIQLKEEMHMLCAKLWVIQLLIGCIECDIQQDNLFSFWYCKLQELHLRIVLSKFPVRLELKEGKSTWKNQLSQIVWINIGFSWLWPRNVEGGKYVHENPAWFFFY